MAAYAEVSKNKLHLTAQVGRIDGSELLTPKRQVLSEAVPLGPSRCTRSNFPGRSADPDGLCGVT
ncbi:MAG: hypothetical protein Ct9H300mP14_14200 [Gammaproteobacteria bacterium]|nr:MAG: hypothetical protein Ct9H300mP14_14200 [Gammaproteobacteria bacterium]